MADDSVKAIGELWRTIRAAHRAGLLPAPDPAEVEFLGGMFEAVKAIEKKRKKTLDIRQGMLYALSCGWEKGTNTMKDLVTYYRVSTKKQGASGLGLSAQRTAAESFAKQRGGSILKEFTEIESGKKADRPQLMAALSYAKRAGACLLVAKLDRLSRNVLFLASLMEAGVDFTACDMPEANKLTLHIMAAMAEHERTMISARTKAALAEVKKRGVALGSARPGHWEGREEARRRGAQKGCERARLAIVQKARDEYADLLPMIQALRAEGLSLAAIAARLNEAGHRTRRGKDFFPSQVQNILRRGR